MLQLLPYVAQTEWEIIHQRQAEGIASVKERDVQFGRRSMVHPKEYDVLKLQWETNRISAKAAAKQLGISPQNIFEMGSRRKRIKMYRLRSV